MSSSYDTHICPGFNFNTFNKTCLTSLALLLGIVSCIACLYIFIIYMINKCRGLTSSSSLSSYSLDQSLFQGFNDQSSMIVFLAFSDFFLAISSIIEGVSYFHSYSNESTVFQMCDNKHLCNITSSFSIFFGFSSFLWTAAMSHSSYTSVAGTGIRITTRTSFALLQCSMFRYHVLCWGLSLIPIISSILSSASGPYSNSCWIITSNASNPYNDTSNLSKLSLFSALLIYILPLLFCEAYNIHVFRFLANTLKRIPNGNALLNRFTRYLSIVIGTKAFYLFTRVAILFAPLSSVGSSSSTWSLILSTLVIISGPIQGCGDFIIFRDSQGRRNDESISRRGSRGSLTTDNSDNKDIEFVQVNNSQEEDVTHNPINLETRGRKPYRVERQSKRKSGKGMYMMIGTSVIDKSRSMSIDTSVTEEGEEHELDDSDDENEDDDVDDDDSDDDEDDIEAKVHLTTDMSPM